MNRALAVVVAVVVERRAKTHTHTILTTQRRARPRKAAGLFGLVAGPLPSKITESATKPRERRASEPTDQGQGQRN